MKHNAYLERLDKTIVAIATPPGIGAIGMVRLSGSDAFSISQKVTKTKADRFEQSHRVFLVTIRDGDEVLDQAVMLVYKAPHSYTGEDVVEFSCHGSPYILRRLVELLVQEGAVTALPGEFTFRAFYHGKLNLLQAEAVADLISAEHQMAHHLAMQQLRGHVTKRLHQLREQLVHFTALLELELDFADEDVTFADRSELKTLLLTIQDEIDSLIASFRSGQALKEGIPVVILGMPNAGKSTLLNALVEEDRAIVTEIPGTTRDVLEERFVVNGFVFRLLDTAGLRVTEDPVEKIGIEKALASIQKAHILLVLRDTTSTSPEAIQELLHYYQIPLKEKHVLYLANKIDLTPLSYPPLKYEIPISAQKGIGIEKLKEELFKIAETYQQGNVILTNVRHYECLLRAKEALKQVYEGLTQGVSNEFLALDLRQALDAIGEITGEITTETILTDIFSNFCIGK